MEIDFGLIESIFAGTGTAFAGIVKYVHGQMVKKIDDLQKQLAKSEKMLNGRIDRVKTEHKEHAEKSNEQFNQINIKLERILTLMERDDHN